MSKDVFQTDAEGNQFYARDSSGDEVYPSGQYVFAKKTDGTYHYARKADLNEFYPVVNGIPMFKPISDTDSQQVYAKNQHGDEIYPVDPQTGNEINIFHAVTLTPIYTKTFEGDEVLPKDSTGREMEIQGLKARDRFRNETYPRAADGRPVYPKDANGNEYYSLKGNLVDKFMFGVHRGTASEVYARKQNGDEFYPSPVQYAYHPVYRTYLYAKSHSGEVIFPIDEDNGNETYIYDYRSDKFVTTLEDGQPIHRYAREKDDTGFLVNEIYPFVEVDSGYGFYEEVVETLGYRMQDGKARYPLDEYGNEYVIPLPGSPDLYPNDYPVTWDLYPIVLGDKVTGKPILNPKNPSVKEEHLTRNIGRHFNGFRDFVSYVKMDNLVTLEEGYVYQTRKATHQIEEKRSWTLKHGLIFLSVIILLGILFLSLF